VQLTKLIPPSDLSTRVEQLTRELGHQRQEIQFYRQCFENLQELRDVSCGVYQELYLAVFLGQPEGLGEPLDRLHRVLERSIRGEAGAKRVWMEYWGIGKEAEVDDRFF
jgi:hypothetical protein